MCECSLRCDLGVIDFCVEYCGQTEKLIKLYQEHRVIATTLVCPTCNSEARVDFRRKAWRCDKTYIANKKKRRPCNYFQSLYKGTWLSNAKLDLETNIKFVQLYLRENFTLKNTIAELHLSDKTVVDWCSFMREVFIEWSQKHSRRLGGISEDNIPLTVELDESKCGKRKYNKGRRIEGQWVFGGYCRETKDIFMVPVEKRDSKTLVKLVIEYVKPGTTILTDCWRAYNILGKKGFKHLTVNHSINFVDPITGVHTNNIERTWRDVKNWLPKFGRKKVHFTGYLARVIFLKKYPEPNKRLHHFLLAAADLYPPYQPPHTL